jgi:vacuolar-type H+-ATPase subunit F/Vma7
VLCTAASTSGWILAGLPVAECATVADGCARLAALAEAAEPGVVLVEQAIHDALDAEQRSLVARRPLPLVVPFPGPSSAGEASEADAVIAELLRQAIGYRVRLR